MAWGKGEEGKEKCKEVRKNRRNRDDGSALQGNGRKCEYRECGEGKQAKNRVSALRILSDFGL